jgi:hypothetical protein
MKGLTHNSTPESLHGFWSLFVTQFQGAFSDNVLKNLVVFMLVAMNLTLAEKHRLGELISAPFALSRHCELRPAAAILRNAV